MENKLKASPLLFVFVAAFLWSTGGLFIKWNSLAGLELSCLRSFFALITVALFTRHHGFGLNKVTGFAAVLYAVLVILFVMATKVTTAANAIFLQYTAPVYLLILEPLVYKEKFRGRDLVTVLVCLGAMALFFVGQLRPQDVAGNVMALASGFCFALYFLALRHPQARLVNRASSVIYGNLLVVLVLAPWGLAALPRADFQDAFSVIYLGVVQLGISYTLFTVGMERGVRSLDAGIVCYIEPVLNPVWVFMVLGERPSRWALLGGLIIIVAVIIHMLLDTRSKQRPPLEAAHG
ncbi:MAG TPA: DMT family transporter [Pyrinomonadaceae bacterium]|nr:DMT family transporter [Pyrinomonadaceae bacterium]